MSSTFDPNAMLAVADQKDQEKLTELDSDIRLLGGKAIQKIREVVTSISADDDATVTVQIANGERTKAKLNQVIANLDSFLTTGAAPRVQASRSGQQQSTPQQAQATPAATPQASQPAAQPSGQQTQASNQSSRSSNQGSSAPSGATGWGATWARIKHNLSN